jgi:hypothetical protein
VTQPLRRRVAVVLLAVFAAIAGVLVGVLSGGSASERSVPPPPQSGPFPQPPGSVSVTSYGADPSGRRDSTLAIRHAIAAAGALGGWRTVYFPPGNYLLDDDDGAYQDFLLDHLTVDILGAGPAYSRIVEKVGTFSYPLLKRGKTVFVFSHMSGFYISGLTIDCQTYNAGDTIDDYGDDSTVSNMVLLGARNGSGGTVDRNNVFDLRVLAVCNANPANPLYGAFHHGNTVQDVALNGRGIGANDDLDFSCQHDGRISNVTDTGWGTAIYIDEGVTITNYVFTPGGDRTAFRGYFITDSSHIAIDNFVTYGEGGIISSVKHPSSDITISGERMMRPGYELVVDDANGVTIANSVLDTLQISPTKSLRRLSLIGTTYKALSCRLHPGATLEQLAGVSCP